MSDLMQQTVKVHDILTRYIQIHNDLFKPSIRRIIPLPGIFQPIDYGKHYDNLTSLTNNLKSIISEVAGNDDFACAFREYVQALFQTISSLLGMCKKLYEKGQGDMNSYSKGQYESDLAEYHSYERTYQVLGLHLNQHLR